MSSDETVLALNPDPTKQAVRIEKAKYDIVRRAILENLQAFGPMTFMKLGGLVADQLQEDFDGSISWYYTTVKLDMEARGELRRVPKSRPQLVELNAGK
ncbi:MAG: hypothetical protein QY332_12835 [Anaerolineales bacterium]|nr:MAG: hypothetical protein QY332_12835 [Anaerolineales bacterium]